MTVKCMECGRTGDLHEFAEYWGEGMEGPFDLLCPDTMCDGDGVILK